MLNVFRNWWMNSKYYFNYTIHCDWLQIGWKAALRWILKEISTDNHDCGIEKIKDIIRKELGE